MTYFIANWKQNLKLQEAQDWLTHFSPDSNKNNKTIIAPSHLYLPSLNPSGDVSLAAQNVSPFENGSHTGQIGVDQIKSFVEYCIIGHSETRSELGDTDASVAQKARLLQKANITPIICLDEPYLESQIRTLKLELLELKDIIFAYEPASAIGSGQPETPSRANEVAFKITNFAHNRSLPVLYGGSVDHLNVTDFTSQDHLSGVLVGSASLDPEEFAKIVNSR